MTDAEKSRHFPCRQCGADVEFTPAVGLKCPYCDHTEPIPESAEAIEEFDFEEFATRVGKHGLDLGETKEIRCKDCGAVSTAASEIHSTRCAFCGSPIVIEQTPSADLIHPEALVPFKIDRPQALVSFSQWLASRWFAPSALKKFSETDQIVGLYRPYWTFDAWTRSWYTGERGEHYWVTVGMGKNRRTERRTRWYPASGVVDCPFDDILIPAGRRLDRSTEYRLEELVPYDARYLSGWQAEHYSLSLRDGFQQAKEAMEPMIRMEIEEDIGGDKQRIDSVRTAYFAIKFKHLLLPLWLSSYHFRNRVYQFQINGQTGEVQGGRPYSFWKIFFFVFVLLGIAGLGLSLFHLK